VRTTLTASDAGTGRCVDVLLELSPHDVVASLDIPLRRLFPDAGPGLWLSGTPLDERSTLRQARVQTGCTLVLGGPAEPSSVPTSSHSGVELHVVGGPDAGRLLLLPSAKSSWAATLRRRSSWPIARWHRSTCGCW